MTATAPHPQQAVRNCPRNPNHLRRRRIDGRGWSCNGCVLDWRHSRGLSIPGRTRADTGQVHAWDKWGHGETCKDCGTQRRVASPEYGKARMEFRKGEDWSEREPRCRFDS